jgi:hypothetical protein
MLEQVTWNIPPIATFTSCKAKHLFGPRLNDITYFRMTEFSVSQNLQLAEYTCFPPELLQ